ncbi:hypothetical protein LX36DRAFT_182614 [Colletotrichum falcatum]|nr:hypothetical protein LX36DRAFT_182614 [Colletotrichum falcatum]
MAQQDSQREITCNLCNTLHSSFSGQSSLVEYPPFLYIMPTASWEEGSCKVPTNPQGGTRYLTSPETGIRVGHWAVLPLLNLCLAHHPNLLLFGRVCVCWERGLVVLSAQNGDFTVLITVYGFSVPVPFYRGGGGGGALFGWGKESSFASGRVPDSLLRAGVIRYRGRQMYIVTILRRSLALASVLMPTRCSVSGYSDGDEPFSRSVF